MLCRLAVAKWHICDAACVLSCILVCVSRVERPRSASHENNMEQLFTGSDLFFPYSSSAVTVNSKDMDNHQTITESSEDATSVPNGSLSESPALGVSGTNPRLVNGEAVSAQIVSEADVQRITAGKSVLKKVITVNEAELLQSSGIVNGEQEGTVATVNGLSAQLESRKSPDADSTTQVRECVGVRSACG